MKTVVITGGGSGIGAAIARELAVRGWQVVVTDADLAAADRTLTSLDVGAGQQHEAQALDVVSAGDAARVAQDVATRLGLDGWVNNAGVSFMQRFLDLTEGDYDKTLDVNLKGVFLCGQAAAREMVRTGRQGAIVNTASMAGKQGRVPFLSDYVASKFGVVGLTQAMAFELAGSGIRVNSVCPGYVATPMQERELGWEAALRGVAPEAVTEMMLGDTPLRRLEEPEDVALAVAFLLSKDARFITGEALAVNGGAFMD
ncbi:SDR family NAD(P)-dependent oxidoreductase [Georgenia sp.]